MGYYSTIDGGNRLTEIDRTDQTGERRSSLDEPRSTLRDYHLREWILVSYFTLNSPYEKEIRRLGASCEKFAVDYYFRAIESKGSWLKNCHYRPDFIIHCLDRFTDRDVVWVDSDGMIIQFPFVFDDLRRTGADMAVHYLRGRELLGGTMWVRNSDRARGLLRSWQEMNRLHPFWKEQFNLQIIIERRKEWKIETLPATYTQIFDIMRSAGVPVIEHYQASRRLKKIMGVTAAEKIALGMRR